MDASDGAKGIYIANNQKEFPAAAEILRQAIKQKPEVSR
jgi:hypothetical protein